MDLATYDAVGLVHSGGRAFEEQARFGHSAMLSDVPCPANALAERVESALVASTALGEHLRPLQIRAPMAALAHPDTGPACEAAVRRARACPQEVCLEFEDCAFAQRPADAIRHVRALRRQGLRVGVDARRAWAAATNFQLRMMLDSLRVDARLLEHEPTLVDSIESGQAAGMVVIGEHAYWRDADYLIGQGVTLAVSPRADA